MNELTHNKINEYYLTEDIYVDAICPYTGKIEKKKVIRLTEHLVDEYYICRYYDINGEKKEIIVSSDHSLIFYNKKTKELEKITTKEIYENYNDLKDYIKAILIKTYDYKKYSNSLLDNINNFKLLDIKINNKYLGKNIMSIEKVEEEKKLWDITVEDYYTFIGDNIALNDSMGVTSVNFELFNTAKKEVVKIDGKEKEINIKMLHAVEYDKDNKIGYKVVPEKEIKALRSHYNPELLNKQEIVQSETFSYLLLKDIFKSYNINKTVIIQNILKNKLKYLFSISDINDTDIKIIYDKLKNEKNIKEVKNILGNILERKSKDRQIVDSIDDELILNIYNQTVNEVEREVKRVENLRKRLNDFISLPDTKATFDMFIKALNENNNVDYLLDLDDIHISKIEKINIIKKLKLKNININEVVNKPNKEFFEIIKNEIIKENNIKQKNNLVLELKKQIDKLIADDEYTKLLSIYGIYSLLDETKRKEAVLDEIAKMVFEDQSKSASDLIKLINSKNANDKKLLKKLLTKNKLEKSVEIARKLTKAPIGTMNSKDIIKFRVNNSIFRTIIYEEANNCINNIKNKMDKNENQEFIKNEIIKMYERIKDKLIKNIDLYKTQKSKCVFADEIDAIIASQAYNDKLVDYNIILEDIKDRINLIYNEIISELKKEDNLFKLKDYDSILNKVINNNKNSMLYRYREVKNIISSMDVMIGNFIFNLAAKEISTMLTNRASAITNQKSQFTVVSNFYEKLFDRDYAINNSNTLGNLKEFLKLKSPIPEDEYIKNVSELTIKELHTVNSNIGVIMFNILNDLIVYTLKETKSNKLSYHDTINLFGSYKNVKNIVENIVNKNEKLIKGNYDIVKLNKDKIVSNIMMLYQKATEGNFDRFEALNIIERDIFNGNVLKVQTQLYNFVKEFVSSKNFLDLTVKVDKHSNEVVSIREIAEIDYGLKQMLEKLRGKPENLASLVYGGMFVRTGMSLVTDLKSIPSEILERDIEDINNVKYDKKLIEKMKKISGISINQLQNLDTYEMFAKQLGGAEGLMMRGEMVALSGMTAKIIDAYTAMIFESYENYNKDFTSNENTRIKHINSYELKNIINRIKDIKVKDLQNTNNDLYKIIIERMNNIKRIKNIELEKSYIELVNYYNESIKNIADNSFHYDIIDKLTYIDNNVNNIIKNKNVNKEIDELIKNIDIVINTKNIPTNIKDKFIEFKNMINNYKKEYNEINDIENKKFGDILNEINNNKYIDNITAKNIINSIENQILEKGTLDIALKNEIKALLDVEHTVFRDEESKIKVEKYLPIYFNDDPNSERVGKKIAEMKISFADLDTAKRLIKNKIISVSGLKYDDTEHDLFIEILDDRIVAKLVNKLPLYEISNKVSGELKRLYDEVNEKVKKLNEMFSHDIENTKHVVMSKNVYNELDNFIEFIDKKIDEINKYSLGGKYKNKHIENLKKYRDEVIETALKKAQQEINIPVVYLEIKDDKIPSYMNKKIFKQYLTGRIRTIYIDLLNEIKNNLIDILDKIDNEKSIKSVLSKNVFEIIDEKIKDILDEDILLDGNNKYKLKDFIDLKVSSVKTSELRTIKSLTVDLYNNAIMKNGFLPLVSPSEYKNYSSGNISGVSGPRIEIQHKQQVKNNIRNILSAIEAYGNKIVAMNNALTEQHYFESATNVSELVPIIMGDINPNNIEDATMFNFLGDTVNKVKLKIDDKFYDLDQFIAIKQKQVTAKFDEYESRISKINVNINDLMFYIIKEDKDGKKYAEKISGYDLTNTNNEYIDELSKYITENKFDIKGFLNDKELSERIYIYNKTDKNNAEIIFAGSSNNPEIIKLSKGFIVSINHYVNNKTKKQELSIEMKKSVNKLSGLKITLFGGQKGVAYSFNAITAFYDSVVDLVLKNEIKNVDELVELIEKTFDIKGTDKNDIINKMLEDMVKYDLLMRTPTAEIEFNNNKYKFNVKAIFGGLIEATRQETLSRSKSKLDTALYLLIDSVNKILKDNGINQKLNIIYSKDVLTIQLGDNYKHLINESGTFKGLIELLGLSIDLNKSDGELIEWKTFYNNSKLKDAIEELIKDLLSFEEKYKKTNRTTIITNKINKNIEELYQKFFIENQGSLIVKIDGKEYELYGGLANVHQMEQIISEKNINKRVSDTGTPISSKIPYQTFEEALLDTLNIHQNDKETLRLVVIETDDTYKLVAIGKNEDTQNNKYITNLFNIDKNLRVFVKNKLINNNKVHVVDVTLTKSEAEFLYKHWMQMSTRVNINASKNTMTSLTLKKNYIYFDLGKRYNTPLNTVAKILTATEPVTQAIMKVFHFDTVPEKTGEIKPIFTDLVEGLDDSVYVLKYNKYKNKFEIINREKQNVIDSDLKDIKNYFKKLIDYYVEIESSGSRISFNELYKRFENEDKLYLFGIQSKSMMTLFTETLADYLKECEVVKYEKVKFDNLIDEHKYVLTFKKGSKEFNIEFNRKIKKNGNISYEISKSSLKKLFVLMFPHIATFIDDKKMETYDIFIDTMLDQISIELPIKFNEKNTDQMFKLLKDNIKSLLNLSLTYNDLLELLKQDISNVKALRGKLTIRIMGEVFNLFNNLIENLDNRDIIIEKIKETRQYKEMLNDIDNIMNSVMAMVLDSSGKPKQTDEYTYLNNVTKIIDYLDTNVRRENQILLPYSTNKIMEDIFNKFLPKYLKSNEKLQSGKYKTNVEMTTEFVEKFIEKLTDKIKYYESINNKDNASIETLMKNLKSNFELIKKSLEVFSSGGEDNLKMIAIDSLKAMTKNQNLLKTIIGEDAYKYIPSLYALKANTTIGGTPVTKELLKLNKDIQESEENKLLGRHFVEFLENKKYSPIPFISKKLKESRANFYSFRKEQISDLINMGNGLELTPFIRSVNESYAFPLMFGEYKPKTAEEIKNIILKDKLKSEGIEISGKVNLDLLVEEFKKFKNNLSEVNESLKPLGLQLNKETDLASLRIKLNTKNVNELKRTLATVSEIASIYGIKPKFEVDNVGVKQLFSERSKAYQPETVKIGDRIYDIEYIDHKNKKMKLKTKIKKEGKEKEMESYLYIDDHGDLVHHYGKVYNKLYDNVEFKVPGVNFSGNQYIKYRKRLNAYYHGAGNDITTTNASIDLKNNYVMGDILQTAYEMTDNKQYIRQLTDILKNNDIDKISNVRLLEDFENRLNELGNRNNYKIEGFGTVTKNIADAFNNFMSLVSGLADDKNSSGYNKIDYLRTYLNNSKDLEYLSYALDNFILYSEYDKDNNNLINYKGDISDYSRYVNSLKTLSSLIGRNENGKLYVRNIVNKDEMDKIIHAIKSLEGLTIQSNKNVKFKVDLSRLKILLDKAGATITEQPEPMHNKLLKDFDLFEMQLNKYKNINSKVSDINLANNLGEYLQDYKEINDKLKNEGYGNEIVEKFKSLYLTARPEEREKLIENIRKAINENKIEKINKVLDETAKSIYGLNATDLQKVMSVLGNNEITEDALKSTMYGKGFDIYSKITEEGSNTFKYLSDNKKAIESGLKKLIMRQYNGEEKDIKTSIDKLRKNNKYASEDQKITGFILDTFFGNFVNNKSINSANKNLSERLEAARALLNTQYFKNSFEILKKELLTNEGKFKEENEINTEVVSKSLMNIFEKLNKTGFDKGLMKIFNSKGINKTSIYAKKSKQLLDILSFKDENVKELKTEYLNALTPDYENKVNDILTLSKQMFEENNTYKNRFTEINNAINQVVKNKISTAEDLKKLLENDTFKNSIDNLYSMVKEYEELAVSTGTDKNKLNRLKQKLRDIKDDIFFINDTDKYLANYLGSNMSLERYGQRAMIGNIIGSNSRRVASTVVESMLASLYNKDIITEDITKENAKEYLKLGNGLIKSADIGKEIENYMPNIVDKFNALTSSGGIHKSLPTPDIINYMVLDLMENEKFMESVFGEDYKDKLNKNTETIRAVVGAALIDKLVNSKNINKNEIENIKLATIKQDKIKAVDEIVNEFSKQYENIFKFADENKSKELMKFYDTYGEEGLNELVEEITRQNTGKFINTIKEKMPIDKEISGLEEVLKKSDIVNKSIVKDYILSSINKEKVNRIMKAFEKNQENAISIISDKHLRFDNLPENNAENTIIDNIKSNMSKAGLTVFLGDTFDSDTVNLSKINSSKRKLINLMAVENAINKNNENNRKLIMIAGNHDKNISSNIIPVAVGFTKEGKNNVELYSHIPTETTKYADILRKTIYENEKNAIITSEYIGQHQQNKGKNLINGVSYGTHGGSKTLYDANEIIRVFKINDELYNKLSKENNENKPYTLKPYEKSDEKYLVLKTTKDEFKNAMEYIYEKSGINNILTEKQLDTSNIIYSKVGAGEIEVEENPFRKLLDILIGKNKYSKIVSEKKFKEASPEEISAIAKYYQNNGLMYVGLMDDIKEMLKRTFTYEEYKHGKLINLEHFMSPRENPELLKGLIASHQAILSTVDINNLDEKGITFVQNAFKMLWTSIEKALNNEEIFNEIANSTDSDKVDKLIKGVISELFSSEDYDDLKEEILNNYDRFKNDIKLYIKNGKIQDYNAVNMLPYNTKMISNIKAIDMMGGIDEKTIKKMSRIFSDISELRTKTNNEIIKEVIEALNFNMKDEDAIYNMNAIKAFGYFMERNLRRQGFTDRLIEEAMKDNVFSGVTIIRSRQEIAEKYNKIKDKLNNDNDYREAYKYLTGIENEDQLPDIEKIKTRVDAIFKAFTDIENMPIALQNAMSMFGGIMAKDSKSIVEYMLALSSYANNENMSLKDVAEKNKSIDSILKIGGYDSKSLFNNENIILNTGEGGILTITTGMLSSLPFAHASQLQMENLKNRFDTFNRLKQLDQMTKNERAVSQMIPIEGLPPYLRKMVIGNIRNDIIQAKTTHLLEIISDIARDNKIKGLDFNKIPDVLLNGIDKLNENLFTKEEKQYYDEKEQELSVNLAKTTLGHMIFGEQYQLAKSEGTLDKKYKEIQNFLEEKRKVITEDKLFKKDENTIIDDKNIKNKLIENISSVFSELNIKSMYEKEIKLSDIESVISNENEKNKSLKDIVGSEYVEDLGNFKDLSVGQLSEIKKIYRKYNVKTLAEAGDTEKDEIVKEIKDKIKNIKVDKLNLDKIDELLNLKIKLTNEKINDLYTNIKKKIEQGTITKDELDNFMKSLQQLSTETKEQLEDSIYGNLMKINETAANIYQQYYQKHLSFIESLNLKDESLFKRLTTGAKALGLMETASTGIDYATQKTMMISNALVGPLMSVLNLIWNLMSLEQINKMGFKASGKGLKMLEQMTGIPLPETVTTSASMYAKYAGDVLGSTIFSNDDVNIMRGNPKIFSTIVTAKPTEIKELYDAYKKSDKSNMKSIYESLANTKLGTELKGVLGTSNNMLIGNLLHSTIVSSQERFADRLFGMESDIDSPLSEIAINTKGILNVASGIFSILNSIGKFINKIIPGSVPAFDNNKYIKWIETKEKILDGKIKLDGELLSGAGAAYSGYTSNIVNEIQAKTSTITESAKSMSKPYGSSVEVPRGTVINNRLQMLNQQILGVYFSTMVSLLTSGIGMLALILMPISLILNGITSMVSLFKTVALAMPTIKTYLRGILDKLSIISRERSSIGVGSGEISERTKRSGLLKSFATFTGLELANWMFITPTEDIKNNYNATSGTMIGEQALIMLGSIVPEVTIISGFVEGIFYGLNKLLGWDLVGPLTMIKDLLYIWFGEYKKREIKTIPIVSAGTLGVNGKVMDYYKDENIGKGRIERTKEYLLDHLGSATFNTMLFGAIGAYYGYKKYKKYKNNIINEEVKEITETETENKAITNEESNVKTEETKTSKTTKLSNEVKENEGILDRIYKAGKKLNSNEGAINFKAYEDAIIKSANKLIPSDNTISKISKLGEIVRRGNGMLGAIGNTLLVFEGSKDIGTGLAKGNISQSISGGLEGLIGAGGAIEGIGALAGGTIFGGTGVAISAVPAAILGIGSLIGSGLAASDKYLGTNFTNGYIENGGNILGYGTGSFYGGLQAFGGFIDTGARILGFNDINTSDFFAKKASESMGISEEEYNEKYSGGIFNNGLFNLIGYGMDISSGGFLTEIGKKWAELGNDSASSFADAFVAVLKERFDKFIDSIKGLFNFFSNNNENEGLNKYNNAINNIINDTTIKPNEENMIMNDETYKDDVRTLLKKNVDLLESIHNINIQSLQNKNNALDIYNK